MKYSTLFPVSLMVTCGLAAPIQTKEESLSVPAEAVLGFLDLGSDKDMAFLPVSNGTSSGLLFVNTTIMDAAGAESSLSKRDAEADADAWQWISLNRWQPIYKRDAAADAKAEAWQWVSLNKWQPIWKREAAAEAEAEADAWQWISLNKWQPIF